MFNHCLLILIEKVEQKEKIKRNARPKRKVKLNAINSCKWRKKLFYNQLFDIKLLSFNIDGKSIHEE